MKQILKSVFAVGLLFACASSQEMKGADRWKIVDTNRIGWEIGNKDVHRDHIEMSGLKISAVLRYGMDRMGRWTIDRNFIWPSLRTIPNNTHGSLQRHFVGDWADRINVDGRVLVDEKVKRIVLDGIMTVESRFSNGIELIRTLFPSTQYPAFCEEYRLVNRSGKKVIVEFPVASLVYHTDSGKGVDGSYILTAEISPAGGKAVREVAPEESVSLQIVYTGRKQGEQLPSLDVRREMETRKAFIKQVTENLVLETPDSIVNTMFSFAKIRGSESIFLTKGGYLHGPGGESYYAAVWANDQAEYINPFFPFLGYEIGNKSVMDSFRLFMGYMNPEYEPIPSSIIAEGLDFWHGVGDRGDVAMIAYGASRYALASGNRKEAKELWNLITWCLEYCRRKLNEDGVVTSDSDELEGRFPAGKANLCTSSLYYDALVSASYLAKELGENGKTYEKAAYELSKNIDTYFAREVEGYDTYQYYEGNDVLRSWICVPLTMGIYERKQGTVDALFSERLWTENGLLTQAGSSTFWDRSTLYALRGVYACGERERATKYLKFYSRKRLLGNHVPYAIEAWPEGNQRHLSAESGLYARVITEGLFGIRPVGLDSFILTPQLPNEWDEMALRKIRAFGKNFDIEVSRKKSKILVCVKSENKIVKRITVENGASIKVVL